jgi:hypothetical protein
MPSLPSEWWTYRLSDFLMFSARTYHRLFELYNAEVWPAHAVALGLGLAMAVAARRVRTWAAPAVFGLLALAWCWVAWAFHWQRYATINWAAVWFAAAFAMQAVLFLVAAARAGGAAVVQAWPSARVAVKWGMALLLFALLAQPLVGVALGRPWREAEVFGIAPDPTVSATLGLLLMLRPALGRHAAAWSLWPVPLLWCAVSGATAWAMDAPDAWLMPAVAMLALVAARRAGSR